jgi:16S rRNA processing protein RimM
MPDATRRELKIEDHWFQKDRIVLRFANYDSPDLAETLREADICIAEDEAVKLQDGEYFDWQLAGCKVETTDGVTIGTVRELMRAGGTEILVVDGDKEYLIPFASAICIAVDVENKFVRIDPPDGLLDF